MLPFRSKHNLGLGYQRHQPAFHGSDSRLPHHGAFSTMNGRAFRDNFSARWCGRNEVCLALDCGGCRALGKIHESRHSPQRVGKRHRRTAVQHRRPRAEISRTSISAVIFSAEALVISIPSNFANGRGFWAIFASGSIRLFNILPAGAAAGGRKKRDALAASPRCCAL